eukprot:jgi/Chlat1/4675/Chrsp3S05616
MQLVTIEQSTARQQKTLEGEPPASAARFSAPAAPRLSSSSSRRGALVVSNAATITQKFTKVTPAADRVFVKVKEIEEKSSGGILLPTSAQTKPTQGDVLAVGPGRAKPDGGYITLDVKAGDRVVYSKYAGTTVDLNGTDHVLLKEDDVLGTIASDDIATLKPLQDRVLVKVAKAEETTSGGVLLTDSAKEKPQTGEVVAVGPGIKGDEEKREAVGIQAGSTVLYSKYAGSDFKGPDGTQFVVLRAQDIIATLS